MITRRSIIFGLIAAPVVVRMGLIMPIRSIATQRDLIKAVTVDLEKKYDPYDHEGWGINWWIIARPTSESTITFYQTNGVVESPLFGTSTTESTGKLL